MIPFYEDYIGQSVRIATGSSQVYKGVLSCAEKDEFGTWLHVKRGSTVSKVNCLSVDGIAEQTSRDEDSVGNVEPLGRAR